MIEVVENPTFREEDFDASTKKPGVSAILRLRNEEDYLELALDSIRPFFDEFVIVYNQCTDRTPEIVERFAREEQRRARAFHYVPEVFPWATPMHATLSPNHVNSFVHYSNFALSKVSYQVCLLWDGDMIAAPEPLGKVLDRLRAIKRWTFDWWLSPWKIGFWWHSGVNLWDQDGEIFLPRSWPRVPGRGDHGFWPVGRKRIFNHDPRFEVLNIKRLVKTFVGFLYFHVKGMKKDRGLGIHQVEEDLHPDYKRKIEKRWTNPELMTFEEYCQTEPAARSLPPPESLGIRPIRRREAS